jgi:hypothetical protein
MLLKHQGHTILLDEEDLHFLDEGKWNVTDCGGYLYLMKTGGFPFHRLVTGAPASTTVDHINKDTLDNRKENLRLVTKSENAQNSMPRANCTSQYKGVFKRGDTYRAYINYKGKRIYLGSTPNEPIAASRYDAAAVYLYGQFAAINFPEDRECYLQQVLEMEKEDGNTES